MHPVKCGEEPRNKDLINLSCMSVQSGALDELRWSWKVQFLPASYWTIS